VFVTIDQAQPHLYAAGHSLLASLQGVPELLLGTLRQLLRIILASEPVGADPHMHFTVITLPSARSDSTCIHAKETGAHIPDKAWGTHTPGLIPANIGLVSEVLLFEGMLFDVFGVLDQQWLVKLLQQPPPER
jgi:hypothetical protein